MWQIKWIEKERGSGEETAEVLVSISTDGRVTQWSIRKGFESYGMSHLVDILYHRLNYLNPKNHINLILINLPLTLTFLT